MEEKKRKVHIDILRIMAAFLVLFNHTEGHAYYMNYQNGALKLLFSIGLSAITKINIPMFYMLSGALLLGKEESYSALLKKRVGRFFLALLGASVCAYCYLYRGSLSLKHFWYVFLSCNIVNPYWFLYAYLAFLLALPLLRKLAKNISGQDILFLLILRFVFSSGMDIWQYISQCNGWDFTAIYSGFTLPFATVDILFYPLLGYYLEHKVETGNFGKQQFAFLIGGLVAAITGAVGMVWHQGIHTGSLAQKYSAIFVYIAAPCLYLLVKAACEKITQKRSYPKMEKGLSQIAGLTLGIYLMDPIFMVVFGMDFVALAGDSLYLIPLSVVYCCISMVVCGSITWILKKIPGIRKLL